MHSLAYSLAHSLACSSVQAGVSNIQNRFIKQTDICLLFSREGTQFKGHVGQIERDKEWERKGEKEKGTASLDVGQFFAREIIEMLNKQNVTLFTE